MSPSRLIDFFGCPHSLALSQDWEYTGEEEGDTGSQVHHLLGTSQEPTETTSSLVALHWRKLRELEQRMGFVADENGREIRDEYELVVGDHLTVHVVRILDVRGRDSQGPLVLDYKTAGSMWSTITTAAGWTIPPQAFTFQASWYVMPRPDQLADDWPDRIRFLVSSPRERAQWFEYTRNLPDTLNLMRAIEYAARSYLLGKNGPCSILNRGRGCNWCNYNLMCWKSPGWEELYTRRRR